MAFICKVKSICKHPETIKIPVTLIVFIPPWNRNTFTCLTSFLTQNTTQNARRRREIFCIFSVVFSNPAFYRVSNVSHEGISALDQTIGWKNTLKKSCSETFKNGVFELFGIGSNFEIFEFASWEKIPPCYVPIENKGGIFSQKSVDSNLESKQEIVIVVFS